MSIQITEAAIHPHLRGRMQQRDVTIEEMEQAFNEGSEASCAKPGTFGRVLVFPYNAEWEGKYYPEKEVTVYYKIVEDQTILLTVIARYGEGFLDR